MLINRVYTLVLVALLPLKGKTAAEIPHDLKSNMERLAGYDIRIVMEVLLC
jgi:hypothetical protein